MKHPGTAAIVALVGGAVVCAAAAAVTADFPAVGSYRVDVETTRTVPAGPYVMTVVQRTDSETGALTITRRSTLDPENVSTESYPGEKPPLRCVAVAKPPPVPAQYACPGLAVTATSGGKTTHGVCNGLTIDDRWTRIDDHTWDHSLQVTQPPAGGTATVIDVVKEHWTYVAGTCAS